MTPTWVHDAAFYHIYPLALCDAPSHNDFSSAPVPRLERLYDWIDHISSLELNAVYLGPVFESTAHGYDTADYFHVDRRLGTNDTLKYLIDCMKQRGLRVILDGVFNHVGRDFWAFRDVQARGQNSPYVNWFYGIDFNRQSPAGDAFWYEGWAGHYDLVKLNVGNPEVRHHLFDAVRMWIQEFNIDGLRLDAADVIDPDFLRALAAYCRELKPDFWLMGEVVHGDYNHWANPDMLHATTNYESYKGLYSSHVDRNYFEIAYALDRQFGPHGIYRELMLYSFADNHDVNRVASSLTHPAHLYPLHILLFTMPGVPSIYYGSEWGIAGERTDFSDSALRPSLDIGETSQAGPQPDLVHTIRVLAALRRELSALRYGGYEQRYVSSEQFAFARMTYEQTAIVAVNASDEPCTIHLNDLPYEGTLVDKLNARQFPIQDGHAEIMLDASWGSILVIE